jgi:hypothetical protein
MEKSKREKKVEVEGNGHLTAEEMATILSQALKPMQDFQKETRERFEELEKKESVTGQAQLIAAKMVYDTPVKSKRAFTAISLRMVDPFSLADTCAAVLTEEVQSGRMSLGQVRRESIYDHLKSVGARLLLKGADLAMQQEQNKAEGFGAEEAQVKGL